MAEGHVNVPKFGDWEGGEAVQYTEDLDNEKNTKNMRPGLNPIVPQMSQDVGRDPAVASQEGQGRPSAPAHSKANLQPGTGAGRRNQAASIPRFGQWTYDPESQSKNVNGQEVTENETSVNKDIGTQLNQGASPPSQRGCFSLWKSRKPEVSIPRRRRFDRNSDSPEGYYSSECNLYCTIVPPRNYGKAPLNRDIFADNGQPRPSNIEDSYGGGFRTNYAQRGREAIIRMENASKVNGASATSVSLAVHPSHQESTRRVNPIVKFTDKKGGCFHCFRQ